ncbi:replication factor C subunit 3 [Neocloeon triangulifer]|uniref:replication factor C subunit 3 n=1 Tax=Neocloeon triangulifer TaxID=2078957 RepID=UPI00286F8470|nr:replication factor C subunit 3 [Neocloeon triangulifer]
MSLWVDKHCPKSLQKLDYHEEQALQLKHLVQQGDFPHLLVYGPSGAGKKTRVMCLLRELYGSGTERLRIEKMEFQTASKKRLDITTISSNYHIEVNPSDVGIHDRIVVQELIKTAAQAQQFDVNGQRSFKVIVITEVDNLSKSAQHALRRTMEKYVSTCRLVLIANSTARVIPAIRSRCLGIRVAAPTNEQICSTLQNICRKEGLNLPLELAKRIAIASGRNLRRAILMTEACKTKQYPFEGSQQVVVPDWETYIVKTAHMVVQEQSPQCLHKIRERVYELLIHGIPAEYIFRGLLKNLVKNCDGQLKAQVTQYAADYEEQLHKGSKAIFHIEAFLAKFMVLYKTFMEESLQGLH